MEPEKRDAKSRCVTAGGPKVSAAFRFLTAAFALPVDRTEKPAGRGKLLFPVLRYWTSLRVLTTEWEMGFHSTFCKRAQMEIGM